MSWELAPQLTIRWPNLHWPRFDIGSVTVRR